MGGATIASGSYSTAIGFGTVASGDYATALGYNSVAQNNHAIAIGSNTNATGEYAVSIGRSGAASGNEAVAMIGGTASGSRSFAVMNGAGASGDRSIAIGNNTLAPSYGEIALGVYNTSYTPVFTVATSILAGQDRIFSIGNGSVGGGRSDAMVVLKNGNTGFGISTPSNRLEVVGKTKTSALQVSDGAINNYVLKSDVEGNAIWFDPNLLVNTTLDKAYDGTGTGAGRSITADAGALRIAGTDGLVVSGEFGSGRFVNEELYGYGNRMFYLPRKAAFGAGFMSVSNWDPETMMGNHSQALGYSAVAAGNYAAAIGNSTYAQGDYSTAIGRNTRTNGENATAIGGYLTAPSYAETALGFYNTSYTPAAAQSWVGTDRLFVIGNGSSAAARSDALIILKNGNMRIGSRGTYFTNMQDTVVVAGSSAAVTKTVTFNFPNTFASAGNVKVQVQPVNELSSMNDEFIVTVKSITASSATVIIRRMDASSGWGQQLRLHVMAWE